MTQFDITYTDFKCEDTTNDITIKLYGDNKRPITPDASHTWKAKVAKGDKYVGEYPVTISGDTIKLSSSNLTRLPYGIYALELWETYDGSTAIYPSTGTMEFRVHENIDDTLGTVDPTIDINGIIDDLHRAGQNIKVVATNTLSPGSKASVTQSITNGENQLTFNIPQGDKGDKGDPGAPGIPGKDGLTPSIDIETKHWMIGNTDTGIVAEGQPGKDGAQVDLSNYVTQQQFAAKVNTSEVDLSVMVKHVLTADDDVLTLDPGTYWAWGTTPKNYPADAIRWGRVVIKRLSPDGLPNGSNANNKIAEIFDTNGNYLINYYQGNPPAWAGWKSLVNEDFYRRGVFYKPGKMTTVATGAPYDDLNTFPIGQTVTIAETPDKIKQIKNLPPISSTTGGLTVRTESSVNDTIGGIQIAIDNNNVMYHRICWGASGNWRAWRSESVDEHSNNMILPTLSLFQKVGVVGDSYASGELAFDGQYVDHYEISWLQILARKDGFIGTNFSKGGMSTCTWLTNPKCMPLMQSSDEQDLYILALGINDEALGTSYIGSEADIDSGADTFYGNYGKIIKAIQTKAPQAKLVIATIADSSDTATQFNTAITTIANHFAIPVIVQLDDQLFNSSFYKDTMIGGHPTGPVYASMAEAFERLIGQSMIDHLNYYKTFKKDV